MPRTLLLSCGLKQTCYPPGFYGHLGLLFCYIFKDTVYCSSSLILLFFNLEFRTEFCFSSHNLKYSIRCDFFFLLFIIRNWLEIISPSSKPTPSLTCCCYLPTSLEEQDSLGVVIFLPAFKASIILNGIVYKKDNLPSASLLPICREK